MTREQANDLAEQLRDAIGASGLSLNELGKRCDVNHTMLSRFMRGERTLTLPVVSRLCGELGLRLAAVGAETGNGATGDDRAKKGRQAPEASEPAPAEARARVRPAKPNKGKGKKGK